MSATPANSQASLEAKKNGKYYHICISTTPGDLNTPQGVYAKQFFDNAAKFDEKMYDWSRGDVKIYIKGDAQISTEEYAEKMQHIEDRLRESGHAYTIYMFAVSPEVYGSIGRYEQTDFWNYYATHRVPDGDQYYYSLQKNITGGES